MRRGILCVCVLMSGCASPAKPRWEVMVSIGITDKISPTDTVTGSLIFKRPMIGQASAPVVKPEKNQPEW